MRTLMPYWLGDFYCSALTAEEYEKKTLEFIPADARVLDSQCIQSRWFDYQRLHPLQATYYFVECYSKIYTFFAKKYFGKDQVGIKRKEFLESRERTAFWNARTYCDSLGYEYKWYIGVVMKFLLESGRFKNRLPRPCHLILQDDVDAMNALNALWQSRFESPTIVFSKDPYFLTSEWVGDPVQIKHEDMIVRQVRKRPVRHYALSSLVYNFQVFRFERAVQEFPDEVYDMQKDAFMPQ